MRKWIQAEFLFYLAGVYGIFFFVASFEKIHFQRWLVGVIVFLFCVILHVSYLYGEKIFAGCCLGSLCIAGVLCFHKRLFLLQQFQQIFNSLVEKTDGGEGQVTQTVLLFLYLSALLLYVLQLLVSNRWLLFLMTTALLLGGPLIGAGESFKAVLLLGLFQMTFLASIGPFKPLRGRIRLRTAGMLAVAVLVAFLLLRVGAEAVYQLPYQIEGVINRGIRAVYPTSQEQVAVGTVSRGNNYQSNASRMKVTLLEKPEEILYLKGFEGGSYEESNWIQADDAPIFERIAETIGWDEGLGEIQEVYENMPYNLNSYIQEQEGEIQPAELIVEPTQSNAGTTFLPYVSRLQSSDGEGKGYRVSYYAPQKVPIQIENLQDLPTLDWIIALNAAYHEQAQQAYTQVPTELVPRLAAFCAQNPQEGLENITAFILSTLYTRTNYTLTPGLAPLNKDIVEYFLFENQRGYCVHYASAAALMYRLYGIPARYVTGYALQPDAFTQTGDGGYEAEVTETSAHAWVEIYLDYQGWTPVEVTKPISGQSSYAGLDATQLQEEVETRAEAQETALPTETPQQETVTGEAQEASLADTNTESDKTGLALRLVRWLLVVLCCLGMVSLVFVLFRTVKKWMRWRIESASIGQLFFLLVQELHSCGYLKEYEGNEEDFTQRLCEALPTVEMEKLQKMMQIVEIAAYGKSAHVQEDRAFMREIYLELHRELYRRAKWYQKWRK